MSVAIVAWSVLLQAAAPAIAPGRLAASGLESYSLCISERVEPSGKARYVSDPFETWNDEMDARAYQEYIEQAYLHRRDSRNATACRTYRDRPAAEQALALAVRPVTGVKIVETKWRAHFE